MAEAAALPETIFTVWHNLFERAWVREGETVLVHGGTSGIGTTAIGLCKLFDIKIIVTCGSAEHCAAATALGADLAVDRSEEHTSELQSLLRTSYAVSCLQKRPQLNTNQVSESQR